MKAFLLASFALVGLTLLVVFVPVVRNRMRAVASRDQAVISVYRDQLAELDRDVRSGILDQEAFRRSREEIERRLLEDTQSAPRGAATSGLRSLWMLVVGAVFVPAAAIVLYAYLGAPQLLLAKPAEQAANHQGVTMEQIDKMIAKLVAHLKEKPDDVTGWGMLGRTYAVLGRFPESVDAYKKAIALKSDDPRLLSDYADALATSRGRVFDGETIGLLERALKLAPDDPKILALLGSAEYQRKAFPEAIRHWEHALAGLPPESEFAQQLQGALADARKSAGLPQAEPAGAAGPAQAPPQAAAPAATDASTSGAAGKPVASARVSGRVTLAANLAGKANPDDTVFIFARAAEGPRMPLAILRKQVRDLPVDFTLDDTMGMAAGMSLSRFPLVIVGARISKSGQAMPQSGDLEGATAPVAVGATGLTIEIDRTHP
jgi:cytochrome c-type biogenesis protein CcmH